MNVDEAMRVAKRESLGWYDDMHEAGPILATEVERLRAELAAAKAASVVPVKIEGVYENSHTAKVLIEFGSDDDASKFIDWLDRMKERGDG